MAHEEKVKPVHKIKVGAVNTAIWKNETEKGVFFSVTFTRTFMSKDEVLKNTSTFPLHTLSDQRIASEKAEAWINQARLKNEQAEQ